MNKEDLDKILELRKELIDHFARLRDYKSNKNALMKESDHAARIHRTIVTIDEILKEHVSFS
jgi:hypothetical protein|tara:strand:+ start:10119 stop:10304 length:186 start_codon:yes stop_codon:yes gene_type:complete